MAKHYNIMDISYTDIQEFLKKSDMVLIPFGSCEAHGAHLPNGHDSYRALETVKRAAKIADVPYTSVIWAGYSPHHMREPGKGYGTITLRASTLQSLLYDVAKSLIHSGFNKLFFVAGHGSNIKVIDSIFRKLRYETGALIAMYTWLGGERELKGIEDVVKGSPDETPGWHGGEVETAIAMAHDKSLVRMDRAVKGKAHAPDWLPKEFSKEDGTWSVRFKGYECLYLPMEHHEFAPTAVMGNPFRATKEEGNEILDRNAKLLAEILEAFRKIKIEVKVREFTNRV